MDRSRKRYLDYMRQLAKRDPNGQRCDFCHPEEAHVRIKETHQNFYTSYNTFAYTQWELRSVTEHLLLVPKRHATAIEELTDEERTDFAQLVGRYEKAGYDIFARAPSSTSRTVTHQHTHLIRTTNKRARGVFFWSKPYILWLFR
jgi:diadenosine tetraphosphate (Ap4A) HIT family hydrolase